MHVCVLGMGNMGRALADALLASGQKVVVWNRSAEKCADVVAAGASAMATVCDAVRAAQLVVVCLSDGAAVSAILSAPGVADALQGKTLVQLSQTTPTQSQGYAHWAKANGTGYLDGSIMGMPSDVRNGRCMIVYSGADHLFAEWHAVLTDMGGWPRFLGAAPDLASTFDKAFFSGLYAHFAGLIHGAAMCRAAGIPLQPYFELMVGGWDWQGADADYAQMMMARNYTAQQVTLEVHAYAFRQVHPLCRDLGVDVTLPKAIAQAMEASIARGHGAEEIAALIDYFGAPSAQ